MLKRPLIIVALEDELPAEQVPDWTVAVCGVGKVNAALNMQRAITEYAPSEVINLGTAGGITTQPGHLIEVGTVLQRDMDLTGLGLERGITPFDHIAGPITLSDAPAVCGTGDNFLQGPPELECDLVDMELYALAKVCRHHNVPISAYKYISDSADDSAHHDWKDALERAARAFCDFLSTQTLNT